MAADGGGYTADDLREAGAASVLRKPFEDLFALVTALKRTAAGKGA